jgi:Flp pilus assembly protein TadG
MKFWKKITGGTMGAEIAEAAIVLPLVFMLLLGILWLGRAYNIYATITHAAREGARAGTAQSCASNCGNTPFTADQVATRVSQALQASRINPNLVAQLLPNPPLKDCTTLAPVTSCEAVGGGNPQICFQRNVQINAPTNPNEPPSCGVSVSFQYPYQFYLPFTSLNQQLILLKADVQTAGED